MKKITDSPKKRGRIECYGTNDTQKKEFDIMLIDFLTEMNLPFRFLVCQKFKKYVGALHTGYNLLNSKYLNNGYLKEFSDNASNKCREYLSLSSGCPISVLLDEWTNYRNRVCLMSF